MRAPRFTALSNPAEFACGAAQNINGAVPLSSLPPVKVTVQQSSTSQTFSFLMLQVGHGMLVFSDF